MTRMTIASIQSPSRAEIRAAINSRMVNTPLSCSERICHRVRPSFPTSSLNPY